MNSQIYAAIITLFGGILISAMTYWFSKQRELEAESRKEKLIYYKEFVESLSGVIQGESSAEGHQRYAKATNNLNLFAPQPVLVAVNNFREENSISNRKNWTQERHDELLTLMLSQIRSDINISPKDNLVTFKPKLWSSGHS
ncbi:hypothetical protein [Chromobacterium violaceum]|uniref:hypothetical protein n=1 Tax=Chromobacterium violaceum TaxID=536 RepID=UPI0012D41E1C|nr:hypothetical protein [Chromobacterium violaceum]